MDLKAMKAEYSAKKKELKNLEQQNLEIFKTETAQYLRDNKLAFIEDMLLGLRGVVKKEYIKSGYIALSNIRYFPSDKIHIGFGAIIAHKGRINIVAHKMTHLTVNVPMLHQFAKSHVNEHIPQRVNREDILKFIQNCVYHWGVAPRWEFLKKYADESLESVINELEFDNIVTELRAQFAEQLLVGNY